ncbi:RNA 2',3'-cyclic phosphodiesterase [Patulibacter defluvii]|uniref:RNA 2',3'-cyclic phosphodiesterase n=1 Tax=Patulibacter defluvii TaxID=3095358 RepID=UPI002A74D5D2|nr:RNA 2',3'-cyclic phosphodiesterase [Patulibacter sp. DM4]
MAGPRGRRPGQRLFVALAPPAAVGEALLAWTRDRRGQAPGTRPVPAEQLHVTLAFLGARTVAEIDPIADALASAVAERGGRPLPQLRLGSPLWLPPRRPRVLAAEVHDDAGELDDLQAAIATALERAIGWREERPFRAHLTLARMRSDAAPDRRTLPATPAATFVPDAVILYRSHLEPSGARYEPLERLPLT